MSLVLLAFLLLSLFAGMFWLLVAIPFTYHQVIAASVIPGLQFAGQWYVPLYFGLGLITISKIRNRLIRNGLAVGHFVFSFIAGSAVYFLKDVPVPSREMILLFQSAFPAVIGLLLLADHLTVLNRHRHSSFDFELRTLISLLLTMILVTAIFGFENGWTLQGSVGLLTLFLLMFPILIGLKGISNILPFETKRAEREITLLLFFILVYWFIRRQILPALAVEGRIVFEAFAILISIACVTLASVNAWQKLKPIAVIMLVLAVVGLSTAANFYLFKFDWNFLGQKAIFLATTLTLFFLFQNALQELSGPVRWLHQNRNSVTLYGFFWLLPVAGAATLVVLPETESTNVAESFAKEVLRPNPVNNDGFYFLLQRSTNIPVSKSLILPDLQQPELAAGRNRSRPDIFIFVIDSLRRDYLGAYNSAVTFTPALDQFAAESLVFKKAFSRFGATGLSEPSIWAGALVPHQSYPASYEKLNSLEKLIRANSYRVFISQDSILRQILSPDFLTAEIDPKTSTQELDLCETLPHLEELLREQTDGPAFSYTQPQNLHVSVLAQKSLDPANDLYAGFYSRYAESLEKIDRCFGEFISNLKKSGRYDNSLIVVTSDHGDSLGEDGRFGHAYTLFPEIVRIPLLLHMPTDLQLKFKPDLNHVVFQTDITPTLYQLLGNAPQEDPAGIRGKSLLKDARADSESHLLVSSYGPVFALLGNGGSELAIFDAINLKEHLYTIEGNVSQASEFSGVEKQNMIKKLKQKIEEWNAFYGVQHETK